MLRRRALVTLAVLPSCLKQAYYSGKLAPDGTLAIPAETLGSLKSPADVLVVHAQGAPDPGPIAVRRSGAGFAGLLLLCTHRGCELAALPQSYECACHGSRFDLDGEVLEGPAARPLRRFPVHLDRGQGLLVVR